MEHIDALEAVRRLTLERDALAEQVKRLEDSVVWHREELERTRAEWEQQENALQAPVRHERHKTGTEPTEGTNGAPRGCMVPSWGKIALDVIWCASLALKNEIRLADARKDWGELRRLQKGKIALDRIRDELSNIDDPALVV